MINIIEKVNAYYASKIRLSPVKSNRASQIGHPCIRKLFYDRTAWEKQTLPTVELQKIFAAGNFIEDSCIRELQDAGFDIKQQGRDFEDRKYDLTGHIDGFIAIGDPAYYCPLEIKGLSPFSYDVIDSAEDMLKSKKHYIRNYPAQLQIYMFLSNTDQGIFYIKNKVTWAAKAIELKLDYDYCELLLKKIEKVNACVAKNECPDRIEDTIICQDCAYRHICLPDMDFGAGAVIMDNERLLELLTKRDQLQMSAKEYDEVDEEIKEMVKEKPEIICGEYYIKGKWYDRVNYDVPAEIKKEYETKKQYWKTIISKIYK